jgi:hypothetical protein
VIRVEKGSLDDQEKIKDAAEKGCCPDCGSAEWIEGPHSVRIANWTCANPLCGSRFRIGLIPGFAFKGIADIMVVERASPPSPYKPLADQERPNETEDAAELSRFRQEIFGRRCPDCHVGLTEVDRNVEETGTMWSVLACDNPTCGSRFEIRQLLGMVLVGRKSRPSPMRKVPPHG